MRNRNMYYATGIPGWMRFGYSPGWFDRSPTGLGPCASYMMTGSWPTPQAQAYWQDMQQGQAPYPYYGTGFVGSLSAEQELDVLKAQADMLRQQMEQISARIGELEKKDKE